MYASVLFWMHRGARGGVVALLLAVAPWGAAPASADEEAVLVLGVRSFEGDDELAHHVTDAMTEAARDVSGWTVGDRRVSLAQMMLVHGCDEPDAHCMADVAESLQVDRLLFGTLRRTGMGERAHFTLVLQTYAARTGRVEHSVRADLPGDGADDTVRTRAPRWAGRLAGAPPRGLLHVTVNVPGARVRVDGRDVGVASSREGGVHTEVKPGAHRVEVTAEGYGSFRGTVTVPTDEEARVEVELDERASGPLATPSTSARSTDTVRERVVYRSRVTWPTYTSLGVGVASLAVSIFAIARVANLRGDGEVRQWRDDGSFSDACSSARAALPDRPDAQAAVDRCDQEGRLSPLRWVFLALGLAASGAGAYLLWRDLSRPDGSDGDQAQGRPTPRLRLDGDLGRHGGGVSATLRF
jgi:hypothetical protein